MQYSDDLSEWLLGRFYDDVPVKLLIKYLRLLWHAVVATFSRRIFYFFGNERFDDGDHHPLDVCGNERSESPDHHPLDVCGNERSESPVLRLSE